MMDPDTPDTMLTAHLHVRIAAASMGAGKQKWAKRSAAFNRRARALARIQKAMA